MASTNRSRTGAHHIMLVVSCQDVPPNCTPALHNGAAGAQVHLGSKVVVLGAATALGGAEPHGALQLGGH